MEPESKYQCNICLDVLRSARLTECCGQHYCSSCLLKWRNNTCPQCRQEGFRHIGNKSLMREINTLTGNRPSAQYVAFDLSQKYVCGICNTEPLKDPCLTECCGQNFCHSCLTGWLQRQYLCPFCHNQENFTHILNKPLRREIDELFVGCIHHQEGCMWIGRAEHLNKHLTSNDGCEYAEVECPFTFCYRVFKRRDLEHHKRTCQYRRVTCTFCGLVLAHNAIDLHHNECPDYVLSCPNHCNQRKMTRRELNMHHEVCPLEPIDCQFRDAGCSERMLRKDMEDHMEKNAHKHMLMLQQQNRILKSKNWELHRTNRKLRAWNGELNIALEKLNYFQ